RRCVGGGGIGWGGGRLPRRVGGGGGQGGGRRAVRARLLPVQDRSRAGRPRGQQDRSWDGLRQRRWRRRRRAAIRRRQAVRLGEGARQVRRGRVCQQEADPSRLTNRGLHWAYCFRARAVCVGRGGQAAMVMSEVNSTI